MSLLPATPSATMTSTRWLVQLSLALAIAACGSSASPPPPAPVITVTVAPAAATVAPLAQLQFAAAVGGTSDQRVAWSVREVGGCGSVSAGGLYQAPATAPAAPCHLVATSLADPSRSATALVTVLAGTPPPPWRPFSAASPWNTPIPVGAPLESNSAALVAAFISSTPYGPHLDVNIDRYSIPLYFADPATPAVPVLAALGGEGWSGVPSTLPVPIPAGAAPDAESDHHLLVVSADRTVEYGCYDASFVAGRSPAWQAGLCATSDLTGTGVRPPKPQADPWWLAHGARACGFPLVAGLIRVEEVQAGRIDHALVLAYPGLLAGRFTPPASTDSAIGAATLGVPCGGRFQYDPSVDVTTLGLSPAGQAIVRALQVYGAYVGDYSGALSLYAENSPAAQASWAGGVLGVYELEGKLDLTRLRVLQLGTLY